MKVKDLISDGIINKKELYIHNDDDPGYTVDLFELDEEVSLKELIESVGSYNEYLVAFAIFDDDVYCMEVLNNDVAPFLPKKDSVLIIDPESMEYEEEILIAKVIEISD